ncbi:MAG: hypothetical protein JXB85_02070 [Anaerolineales bacterium]|nr:hypothetical protein [Anaerolineales bacterium]
MGETFRKDQQTIRLRPIGRLMLVIAAARAAFAWSPSLGLALGLSRVISSLRELAAPGWLPG